MKKFFIIALAILASASAIQAGDKKEKKAKKGKTETVEVKQPVVLANTIDSVSYALGFNGTNGLIPYLSQQMNVDTAYMAEFIRGFEDSMDDVRKKSLTAYGAGISIASMVENRMISSAKNEVKNVADSINTDLFYRGFLDALRNDSTVFTMDIAKDYVKVLKDREVEKLKAEGRAFLDENAKKEGVTVLPSGLQYKVLRQGNGPVATVSDEVVVKYEGRLLNGTVFDSSYKRKEQTNKFKPTQVIKGWTEALTMMPQGSMWELYIPQELAYGDRQAGQIPPYSTLIFKVELEEVIPAAAPAASTKPESKPENKPAVVPVKRPKRK